MNIIFDVTDLSAVRERYIVLELDTFQIENSGVETTAYAIVEHIGLPDMFDLTSFIDLHDKVIDNYRKQNWNFCLQALSHLRGRWNGELDSFYDNLNDRVLSLRQQIFDPNFNPKVILPAARKT